jgi:hypothetical protein
MPAAASANLNLAQRLTLWNRAYGLGHYVPVFAVSAACALAGAGQHAAVPLRRWLLGASVLHVSIIPFTLLCIMPVNMRLAELRIAANKGEEVQAPEVESLFKKWVHNSTRRERGREREREKLRRDQSPDLLDFLAGGLRCTTCASPSRLRRSRRPSGASSWERRRGRQPPSGAMGVHLRSHGGALSGVLARVLPERRAVAAAARTQLIAAAASATRCCSSSRSRSPVPQRRLGCEMRGAPPDAKLRRLAQICQDLALQA